MANSGLSNAGTPSILKPSRSPVPTQRNIPRDFFYPGMDWVDLFIGSEGTLGVVTQATVRLIKTPGEILAGVIFFPTDLDALNAVEAWRPVPQLRMLEYFDAGSLDLQAEARMTFRTFARAALLIEQQILDESEMDAWEQRLRFRERHG